MSQYEQALSSLPKDIINEIKSNPNWEKWVSFVEEYLKKMFEKMPWLDPMREEIKLLAYETLLTKKWIESWRNPQG